MSSRFRNMLIIMTSLLFVYTYASVVYAEARMEVAYLAGTHQQLKVEVVEVIGQPFSVAWRAETLARPAVPQTVQLHTPCDIAIREGDLLYLTLNIRAVPDSEDMTGMASQSQLQAIAQVSLEDVREPPKKLYSNLLTAQAKWQRYTVVFRATSTHVAGDTRLVFCFGYGRQSIEIGGIQLVNYGNTQLPSDIELTRLTYQGMEADAPWRIAAYERIERLRKANMMIMVVDKSGKPAKSTRVDVQMRRHAFGWGAVVDPVGMLISDEYKQRFPNLFNLAGVRDDVQISQVVDWLQSKSIPVRAGLPQTPGVQDIARGMVEWDVVKNINRSPLDAVLRRLNQIRQADPQARLAVTQAGVLSRWAVDRTEIETFFSQIQELVNLGAPIDVIGLQAHFGTGKTHITPPEEVFKTLDYFAALGKPISIAEYSIETDDLSLAAEYTRDMMIASFSHPSVSSFLFTDFWGRIDSRGAMYDKAWQMTAVGQVFKSLVFDRWWSDASLVSNQAGRCQLRGFLGDYEVTARAGSNTKTVKVKLDRSGAVVKVVL